MNTPKIICLCGSTRFHTEFTEANYRLTLEGNIVLSVGFFMHTMKEIHGEHVGITDEQKEKLDMLHLRKIDLCDEVYVINVDKYIGESTSKEIEYAILQGKPIKFLVPQNFQSTPYKYKESIT